MVLGLKIPFKAVFSFDFARLGLAFFALFASFLASGSVFLNNLYFWYASPYYLNAYLFLICFLLGLPRKSLGLAACIFLLPLSAGLGNQLNAYMGTSFLMLPNAGLDLVAGLFLGSLFGEVFQNNAVSQLGYRQRYSKQVIEQCVPWPIGVMIVMLTISTAIAISRNVYQSAAPTSFKGLLFNLVHFRPIDWHDDYMPISDWVAYALAVAMIILVIGQIKNQENKNQMIFRSIMAGLIVAAFMGISQGITGLGLPENLLNFRKDQLGYAVIGFQPDLHAFAGHMIFGVVGLWGYFYSGISRFEQKFVLLTVTLSWIGLILSKSRALLLIALAAMFVWFIWHLWKKRRHIFLPATVILATIITISIGLIFNYSNKLSGIPVLSWLGELANEFKSRDLTSWSLFSGIFGSRFEIWEAAIRMWWEFPLMGVGQGNFYRLSDIASFSKSHFLILNHGENAHNYYLQTLTETGLIGILLSALALLRPLFPLKKNKLILPALISIISLLLGNIFSHSLLVRENLCLLAVMLGCAYSASRYISSSSSRSFFIYGPTVRLVCAALVVVLISISAREVYRSFGRPPFERGFYCFDMKKIDADGWILGGWKFQLPKEASNVDVEIYFPLTEDPPDINGENFTVNIHVSDESVVKPSSINFTRPGFATIHFELYGNQKEGLEKSITLNIQRQSCYTPRNKGESVDARRLGVMVKSLHVDGLKIR